MSHIAKGFTVVLSAFLHRFGTAASLSMVDMSECLDGVMQQTALFCIGVHSRKGIKPGNTDTRGGAHSGSPIEEEPGQNRASWGRELQWLFAVSEANVDWSHCRHRHGECRKDLAPLTCLSGLSAVFSIVFSV